jgi:hypothetical protein
LDGIEVNCLESEIALVGQVRANFRVRPQARCGAHGEFNQGRDDKPAIAR